VLLEITSGHIRTILGILEPFLPLVAAAFAGGMVGLERSWANKPAGLRTNIMICVGSCLYSMMSREVGLDPSRIAAQIVTGVGFLGAGAVMKFDHTVTGLTTAATIWLVAAIGMTIGFGFIGMGITVAIFATILLSSLGKLEFRARDDDENSTD